MNPTAGIVKGQALLNCILTHPENTVIETKKITNLRATETAAVHLVAFPDGEMWAVLGDDSVNYRSASHNDYTVVLFDSESRARDWWEETLRGIEDGQSE